MGQELRECDKCAEHLTTIEELDTDLESMTDERDTLKTRVEELEDKLERLREPINDMFRSTQEALKLL